MLISTGFTLGIVITGYLSLYNWLAWSCSVLLGIRVESVVLFSNWKFAWYQKTINGIQLVLGWVPLSSSLKLDGMGSAYTVDEQASPTPYGFDALPIAQQLAVHLSTPLLWMLIGGLCLNYSSSDAFWQILWDYASIAFFLAPMESGDYIWQQALQNGWFIVGLLGAVQGLGNLIIQIASELSKRQSSLYLLLIGLPIGWLLFVMLPLRLFWEYGTLAGAAYFLLGAYGTGFITLLVSIGLAQMMPNPPSRRPA